MELLDDAENSGWILRWIREVSGVQINHQKWCWYWGQGKGARDPAMRGCARAR